MQDWILVADMQPFLSLNENYTSLLVQRPLFFFFNLQHLTFHLSLLLETGSYIVTTGVTRGGNG